MDQSAIEAWRAFCSGREAAERVASEIVYVPSPAVALARLEGLRALAARTGAEPEGSAAAENLDFHLTWAALRARLSP